MSFNQIYVQGPSANVLRDGSRTRSMVAEMTGLALSGPKIRCPDWFGEPHDCPQGAFAVHEFAVPLLRLATGEPGIVLPPADYYLIGCEIEVPGLLGWRACRPVVSPTDGGWCAGEYTYPVVDGVVEGQWVRFRNLTNSLSTSFAQSVTPTFHSGAPSLATGGWWPGPGSADSDAWMLNPDPTLPVPDPTGNTFGQVLFRDDRMPDGVRVTIAHSNMGQSAPGRLRVYVVPYMLDQTVSTILAGPATTGFRRRKRVVGDLIA